MAIPKSEYVLDFDLTKLQEHPENPRKLSAEGEKKLDASLQEYGMLDAIVANRRDDGTVVVVGGHQRLKALLKEGVTKGLVSLVKVDDVQERKLLLMLNGHHGNWDGAKLDDLLSDLNAEGVDLGALGLEGTAVFEEHLANLANAGDLASGDSAPAETREINVDDLKLKHRCPKCGFEFDKDTNANGRRADGAGKGHRLSVRPVEGEGEPAKEDEEEETPAAPAKRRKRHVIRDDE